MLVSELAVVMMMMVVVALVMMMVVVVSMMVVVAVIVRKYQQNAILTGNLFIVINTIFILYLLFAFDCVSKVQSMKFEKGNLGYSKLSSLYALSYIVM